MDEDSVKATSTEDIPDAADGKVSRFDVHVRTASRRYNVEMQARSAKSDVDYGNDMAVARDEGRAETYAEFVESLRLSGFSEEQIKKIVGDRYQG